VSGDLHSGDLHRAAGCEYFGEQVPATVAEKPLFDPKMTRICR
jgi:hypothetical protein